MQNVKFHVEISFCVKFKYERIACVFFKYLNETCKKDKLFFLVVDVTHMKKLELCSIDRFCSQDLIVVRFPLIKYYSSKLQFFFVFLFTTNKLH